MNKKFLFLPGWMYSPEYFKLGPGLNIWEENIDVNQSIDCDFLVGHSMGAAVALKLWEVNKDKNIILVNPFIDQKSLLATIINWCKYILSEGLHRGGLLGLRHLNRNLKLVSNFPDVDYWKIIGSVPKDKIKILHGEKDMHLCGKTICNKISSLGFEINEVSGAGHDWNKAFDDIIEEILSEVDKTPAGV